MPTGSILSTALLGCALLAPLAAKAATEVVFVHGKTLEIESYRQEGNAIWLRLPGGGEMAVLQEHVVEIRSGDGRSTPIAPPAAGNPAANTAGEPASNMPGGRAARPARPTGGGPGGLAGTIHDIATRHGVDPELVRAIIQVESGWDPRAVSPAGAMGLMQLMPDTAKARGVTDPFDPVQNLEAGTAELAALLEEYSGELSVALAAYNAGGQAVTQHEGIPPYRETLDYVQRVLNLYFAKTSRADPQRGSP